MIARYIAHAAVRAAVVLSAGVALVAPLGALYAAEQRSRIEFEPAHPSALTGVIAARVDLGRGPRAPIAVSDAMLEVVAVDGDAAAVLAAPDGEGRASGARRGGLFRVRLLAVVAGRLRPDASGWCAPWRQDESWCEIDCDGGGFMLRRSGMRRGSGLEVTIETGRGGDVIDSREGVSLAACRTDEQDLRLLPADGQPRARIPFVER